MWTKQVIGSVVDDLSKLHAEEVLAA